MKNRYFGEELVSLDLNLPVSKYAGDETQWKDVITTSGFLPRLQLFGGNSNACKEGKIPLNHYGLARSKDAIDDLGATVNCLPLVWRYKSMKITPETIINYYNPQSDNFKKLIAESEVPDSGAMFGVEFLIWIPDAPGECFSTFFLNSKSSRREAPNIRNLLKRAATLRCEIVKKGKFVWPVPKAVACSAQLSKLPSNDDMLKEADRFANPKESEVESVDAAGAATAGGREV